MTDESIALLRSIDATLRELLALSKSKKAGAAAPAATTIDLDDKRNDPIVKAKPPRDWSGDDMFGRHLSECPPEYLDLLASRYDYFAGKEPDAQKKRYNELDRDRARAWAARLRAHPPAPTAEREMPDAPKSSDLDW
jgi:hypothetical protein